MAIDRRALKRIADADYPDTALVGVPVSMIRELARMLPLDERETRRAFPGATA